jgi:hypothetical protein
MVGARLDTRVAKRGEKLVQVDDVLSNREIPPEVGVSLKHQRNDVRNRWNCVRGTRPPHGVRASRPTQRNLNALSAFPRACAGRDTVR